MFKTGFFNFQFNFGRALALPGSPGGGSGGDGTRRARPRREKSTAGRATASSAPCLLAVGFLALPACSWPRRALPTTSRSPAAALFP